MVASAAPVMLSPCAGQLEECNPKASLAERLDALENVARWVIEIPALKRLHRPAPLQLQQLRTLLDTLKAEPHLRQRFTATLASVLRDTTAVALFAESGMPNDRGLASETMDRAARRILPRPPDDEDLDRFVSRIFRTKRDCAWIEDAPVAMFEEFADVLGDIWGPLCESMEDANALLCTRVSALGLSADLRERSDIMLVRDSPFFRLPLSPLDQLQMVIAECRGQLDAIRKRLETTGVSVDVVYCIDAIRRMLQRIDRMHPFLDPHTSSADRIKYARGMLSALTHGRLEDESLRQLARQNLGLLARKIIERVGHTGEHYVTSGRRDYFRMLGSAAGGGALTAFTVVMKVWSKTWHLAPFLEGLVNAGNYAGSFIIMQLLGFTLATKQPSMTAAALAQTIKEAKGEHRMDELVTLIKRISRSQFAAAVGNVTAVIPVVIALDFLSVLTSGDHFLSADKANATIASFHPFKSGTIIFAALTGVLLWVSSLGAGWLENWVTYRRLPEAIRHHRLKKVFGQERMNRVAKFITDHSAGIGGNVTLGFLLAMTPVFGMFFGLPLDVRHITLSTGSLTFSVMSLGGHSLTLAPIVGIAIIGMCNFGVSFALALTVALRAREVTTRERVNLAVSVLREFLRRPHHFFYPPKDPPGRAATPLPH